MSAELSPEEIGTLANHRHKATRTCIHTADGFKECEAWATYFAPVVQRIVDQREKTLRETVAAEIEAVEAIGFPEIYLRKTDAARIVRGASA